LNNNVSKGLKRVDPDFIVGFGTVSSSTYSAFHSHSPNPAVTGPKVILPNDSYVLGEAAL
jgi:hypothetical protein